MQGNSHSFSWDLALATNTWKCNYLSLIINTCCSLIDCYWLGKWAFRSTALLLLSTYKAGGFKATLKVEQVALPHPCPSFHRDGVLIEYASYKSTPQWQQEDDNFFVFSSLWRCISKTETAGDRAGQPRANWTSQCKHKHTGTWAFFLAELLSFMQISLKSLGLTLGNLQGF